MRLFVVLVLVVGGLFLLAPRAGADPVAAGVTVTGYTYLEAFQDYTMGYRFTPNVDVDVVSLGAWDYGGNGLSAGHDVGLWTDDGTELLTSLNVASGNAAYLSQGFRWTDLDDAHAVRLRAGETYRVGAYFDPSNVDLVAYSYRTTIQVDPRIRYDGWAATGEQYGTLFFPINTGVGGISQTHLLGGNIRVADVVVPEPTSLALLGLGLGCVAVLRHRRRRTV